MTRPKIAIKSAIVFYGGWINQERGSSLLALVRVV